MKKNMFSGYIKKIYITGIDGELDIYSGHAPLLTIIKSGILYIFIKNKLQEYFYVSGGILEVQPDNINILPDIIIQSCNFDLDEFLKKKHI